MKPHSPHRLLRAACICLWLVSCAWLLRFEAFPEFFTQTFTGYRSFLSRDVLVSDTWMRIMVKGRPVGFSHSTTDVDESNPVNHYELRNQVQMKLTVLDTEQTIRANTEIYLDIHHQLQKFSFMISAQGPLTHVSGKRVTGNTFDVRIRTGSFLDQHKVVIPDDVVIYSPQMELSLKDLKPGQSLNLKTLDPVTLQTASILIKAVRKEKISIGKNDYDSTVISSQMWGRNIYSWINNKGEVLKQETPFGWTFEKSTADEAFKAFSMSDGGRDILTDMSVPCTGTFTGQKSLKLLLKDVSFSEKELSHERINLISITDDNASIILKSERLPSSTLSVEETNILAMHLKPSSFIQSNHKRIISQARKITEDKTSPLERAQAIYHWVHDNINKEITASLPSALEVLKTRSGDCNEHTYLFTALARAAGLPAKVTVGLAYHKNRFYYHAWPSVYVGEWLEMDPTWGQMEVDASHLPLVEGELASQYQLLKVLGRLKIEILNGENK